MALSAALSSGSPVVSPSINTREWHPARTNAASCDSFVMGVSKRLSVSSFPPFFFFDAAVSFDEEVAMIDARSPTVFPPMTPTGTSSSVVNVPVLSNRQASSLPAMGTRYGSVQKICNFINVMSELFTARAICIGSSGGMTLVTMRMQCNSSSYWERFSSRKPWYSTYEEDATAKKKRRRRSSAVSFSCPLTFSCEPSIMRTSLPCAEEKPVRRTKQMQPPSGGWGMSPYAACGERWVTVVDSGSDALPRSSSSDDASSSRMTSAPLHCNIFVPAYKT
mmetsp:Transcript_29064/g.60530  ORF Transcript_29064/g.60530 Transcript_29064/m.60530 type:complete len:278 (-) Transcript_29064:299-1132(-)